MRAIKLFTTSTGDSAFVHGFIPDLQRINADYFFVQSNIEAYEKKVHTAPRRQFVVTLNGRLKFTVTNGESFVIEPGVLIADDLNGKGHSWQLIEGEAWNRAYIVPEDETHDFFTEESY